MMASTYRVCDVGSQEFTSRLSPPSKKNATIFDGLVNALVSNQGLDNECIKINTWVY